jgi:hypothetical protein
MLLMRWAFVTRALPVLVRVRRRTHLASARQRPYGRQPHLQECEVAHIALWSQRARRDLSTRL